MANAPRIAVIGGGLAGIAAAQRLQSHNSVYLFEKAPELGGDLRPQEVAPGRSVDMGPFLYDPERFEAFFNLVGTYPLRKHSVESLGFYENTRHRVTLRRSLSRPVDRLNWPLLGGGLGYVGGALFANRTLRAPEHATFGEHFGQLTWMRPYFQHFLIPILCGLHQLPLDQLFACQAEAILSTARRYIHRLSLDNLFANPVIFLDSAGAYLQFLEKSLEYVTIKRNTAVTGVQRSDNLVRVRTQRHKRALDFDHVIIAVPPAEALAMLSDPTREEAKALGSFERTPFTSVLHTDASVCPPRWRPAQITAISHYKRRSLDAVSHFYDANRLYQFRGERNYFVSFNPQYAIADKRVLATRTFMSPVPTPKTLAGRDALNAMNGGRRTWFCGAHLGETDKFHEGAVRSALSVADTLLKGHTE